MSGLIEEPACLGEFNGNFPMRQHRMTVDQMRTVFKTGFRVTESGLFLFLLPAPDQTTRLMVMVRKKLFKKAVDRNRVRRVIRESLRNCPNKKEFWVVADLRKSEFNIHNQELFHLSTKLLVGAIQ